MNAPNLIIAHAALEWFRRNNRSTGDDAPGIATLVWSCTTKWTEAGWSAAFYRRDQVASDLVVEIGGIDFAFEPLYFDALDGRTIDLL